jgi:hypothetical protein
VAEILNVEEVSHDLIVTIDPSIDGRPASSLPDVVSVNRNGKVPWPVVAGAADLALRGTGRDGKRQKTEQWRRAFSPSVRWAWGGSG